MGHAIMPFAETALWMHSVELITIKKYFYCLQLDAM
jgi:hypothetical protein